MLNLECVEPTRKIKGTWSAGGQNGPLPILRPRSRHRSLSRQGFLGAVSGQAVPCRDRVGRPGTRSGLCVCNKPAWAQQKFSISCYDRISMSRQG